MGKQSYAAYRVNLKLDDLLSQHYATFCEVPDPRNRVIKQSVADIYQSAFAMFHLKFPSLLAFDTATTAQQQNLKQVYGLNEMCSDSQMRRILDQLDTEVVHRRIEQLINEEFRLSGTAREYEVLDRRLIVSLDGVEHFRSSRVKCDQCLVKKSKQKGVSYSHQMLCGSIVHPDKKQVFLAVSEPIVKQDGQSKNDCERNAAKRAITKLSQAYPAYKLLVVADGLYSCGPILDQLLLAEYDFVISAKPGDHKGLFRHFETWSQRRATKKMLIRENGLQHCFEWANNLGLNETWPDLKINMLSYKQTDRHGKVTTFSWVTNRTLSKRNVEQIMRIGRSRWKVENETFNTLKNQGYNFEHNYGHGTNQLCTNLAYLMLLAFLTDQIIETCSSNFQVLLKATKTRTKLWTQQRALFTSQPFENFHSIFGRLAELYGLQLV